MEPMQSSRGKFQEQSIRSSSVSDGENIRAGTSPGDLSDLEKAETLPDLHHANTSVRVSRIQSLTNRKIRSRFNHPLSHVKTSDDVLVDFDGPDDPYRPINWPFRKKVITTLLYGFTTMGSTWASSVYSPAIDQIAEQFHVGPEVTLLGLSVLLLGFGCGPLIWAPLSEVRLHCLACIFEHSR